MRVVYIAYDGKEFDDEYECEHYEWELNHQYLKDVHFYDKNGNELEDKFSDDTYGKTEKIVVLNKDALKDLQELERRTGFLCYRNVVECGVWIFDHEKEIFIKL